MTKAVFRFTQQRFKKDRDIPVFFYAPHAFAPWCCIGFACRLVSGNFFLKSCEFTVNKCVLCGKIAGFTMSFR